MKQHILLLSIIWFLLGVPLALARDYYQDGQVYQQLYRLSLDLQSRLYKDCYIDRQLGKRFPEVFYFYGRVLQLAGQNDRASEYLRKFQHSSGNQLKREVGQIAEWISHEKDSSRLEKKLARLAASDNVQVLSALIFLPCRLSDALTKKVYQRLLQQKPDKKYDKGLQAMALAIYRFRENPGPELAKPILALSVPCLRHQRNFFYDPSLYLHLAHAAFTISAASHFDPVARIESLIIIGKLAAAQKLFQCHAESWPKWQANCLSTRLTATVSEEAIFQWTEKFQEQFKQQPAKLAMLQTLLAFGKNDIAAMYLGPEILQGQQRQAIWEIEYRAGDKKMRDHLRQKVDNWWSLYGVEELSALEMLQTSRYLLGDHFITPHLRRLLAVGNPLHPKGKILKNYPQAKTLRSAVVFYVGAGRK